MGILQRFFDIFRSKANQAADDIENPEEMIRLYQQDAKSNLEKMLFAVGDAIAAEKTIQQQYDNLTADIKKWEKHAEQAVAAGRDDLAEKALEEQAYDEERLKNLLPALASAKAQTAKMKASVEKMKETIRQNEADSSVLIARAKAARALEGSAKAMSKISGGNPFDGIKSMEEKISAQENRAEAIEELTKSAQSTLEDEFKKISSSASVKEKLAAIKAKTEVKL